MRLRAENDGRFRRCWSLILTCLYVSPTAKFLVDDATLNTNKGGR